jgi:hypothetical protein
MAARTRRIANDANTRAKIQATQLINRLTNHALSDEDIMSQSQVNAAKVLLGKILPDLKATELSTSGDDNKVTGFKIEVVSASASKDS